MDRINVSINGIDFAIIKINNKYEYYKIENGKQVIPTYEELKLLEEKIKELNKTQQNVKLSIDELKENIKKAIDEGMLTDINKIDDYLKQFNVSDNKELKDYAIQLLEQKNIKYTPIEEIKEKITKEMSLNKSQNKEDDKSIFLNFTVVRSSINNPYLKIELNRTNGNVKFEYETLYCDYNEKSKKELVEEIIKETVLQDKTVINDVHTKEDLFNYLADYYFKSENNQFIKITDLDQEWARDIQELVNTLKNKYGEKLSEEETIDAINDFERKNGGPKLALRKAEKTNGFTSIVLIIISAIIALGFIIYQILSLRTNI